VGEEEGEEEGGEDGVVDVAVADASSCRAASTVVLSCASGAAADADAAAAALTRLGFDEVVQEEENERGECPCEDRGGDRGGDGGVEINDVAIAAAHPPRHPDSCLACIPAARERRQRRLRSCCCCCLEKNATSSRIDFSPPSKFFPV